MNVLEATALPQLGDTAFYRSAAPQARKVLVTVTGLFANGRIKVTLPNGTWKCLPRHYHKRVQNQRYRLVRIGRRPRRRLSRYRREGRGQQRRPLSAEPLSDGSLSPRRHQLPCGMLSMIHRVFSPVSGR